MLHRSNVQRLSFVGAVLFAACASVPEGAGPEISAVEVVNDAGASLEEEVGGISDLTSALANYPPQGLIFIERARLDPLALEIDRRRVESFFREQGYFAAEVGDPVALPAVPAEDGVILRFVARPGAPSRVVEIVIEGAPEAPGVTASDLRALLEIREGELFKYPVYARDKERLREHLFRSGYAYAAVSGRAQVARSTAEVRVEYDVKPGPPVRFGTARVEGRTEVPEDSILARVDFEPGDPFDPEKLSATEKRAYELDAVGSVRFGLDEAKKSEVADVSIEVSDALPNELRFGGGIGVTATRYELTGRAAYSRRRFFHPLYSFNAELRPSLAWVKTEEKPAPNIEARAEIQRDDLFIHRLTGTVGASFELSQLELYRTLGPSVFFGLDRPLFGDRVHAAVRLELNELDLQSSLDPVTRARVGFYDFQQIASIKPSIAWDARDDILSPRRGALLRVEFELGRTLISGGGLWGKVTPEARGYLPLGTDRLIFAARVRAGFAFSGDAALPAIRRYFSGGSENQRGFSRRLLAPDAVTPDGTRGPVGGEALAEASVELRADLVRLFDNWLGLVAFLDAGDVTLRPADLDLGRLHLAAGPGLRYRTPVGPLRFDFGFRLNRTGAGEPEPDSDFSFHFSLGEAF